MLPGFVVRFCYSFSYGVEQLVSVEACVLWKAGIASSLVFSSAFISFFYEVMQYSIGGSAMVLGDQ